MSNPGKELAAKRRKVEKICPLCKEPYEGLVTSKACKKCSQRARYLRWKEKKKIKKLKN
jgi:Zn finger protein HypA/HybF involved in hydrogenase expression